jgi:hypothetical protein
VEDTLPTVDQMTIIIEEIAEGEAAAIQRRRIVLIENNPVVAVEGEDIIRLMAMTMVVLATLAQVTKLKPTQILRRQMVHQQYQKTNLQKSHNLL